MPFSASSWVTSTWFRANSGVPSAFMQAETTVIVRVPCQCGMGSFLLWVELTFEPGDAGLQFFDRVESPAQAGHPPDQGSLLCGQPGTDLLILGLPPGVG